MTVIVIDAFGEDCRNDNGERLIDICEEIVLKISNPWFQHKNIHSYTWTQNKRNLRSIIDYIVLR